MAIALSVFASDLAAVIADLPATATWQSINFSVSLTELSEEQTLMLTGDIDKILFSAIGLISSFSGVAPLPQNRIPIIKPGDVTATNFEIVSVNISADGNAYRLILKSDHRNA